MHDTPKSVVFLIHIKAKDTTFQSFIKVINSQVIKNCLIMLTHRLEVLLNAHLDYGRKDGRF